MYVLKWKMGTKERGRHHMAAFVPDLSHKDADPSTEDCLGTSFGGIHARDQTQLELSE
jgi:hypothetical protein